MAPDCVICPVCQTEMGLTSPAADRRCQRCGLQASIKRLIGPKSQDLAHYHRRQLGQQLVDGHQARQAIEAASITAEELLAAASTEVPRWTISTEQTYGILPMKPAVLSLLKKILSSSSPESA